MGPRMDRKKHHCLSWIVLFWMLFSAHSMEPMCPVRKAVTYNTALLDMPLLRQLPNTRLERRYYISKALRRLDADVICLQEVWIGEDVEFLTKSLMNEYPFSFSKIHHEGQVLPQIAPKHPPCNHLAISNFLGCMSVNRCVRRKRGESQIYMCMVTSCFVPYLKLSQKCVSCVVSGFTQPQETYAKCAGYGVPTIGMRDINEPGLVLLSKTPIHNTRYVDFHPNTKNTIERGFLEADSIDMGKFVCTHLSRAAPQPVYYEPELLVYGVFNSYTEEGASERGQLIDRFRHVTPLLLMGDFNVGDAFGPFLHPELPKQFRYMAMVFDIVPLKICTLCSETNNPYNGRVAHIRDSVVDHVFYRGHKVKDVVRVITPLDAVLLSGLPLSDHYGVMALIELC